MSRRLKNYAVSHDALEAVGALGLPAHRLALWFLRGLQRSGTLDDQAEIDKVSFPIEGDSTVIRVVHPTFPEIKGFDVIQKDGLEDAKAIEILNLGKPDGIDIRNTQPLKLVLP